jgi:hypothetical protein
MTRRLQPLADREAMLALGLAGLGFVSMQATVPAAGVLGVRAIRSTRTGGDGTGPAIGVMVLGISWLSVMWGLPIAKAVTQTASHAEDIWPLVGFVVGWIALAITAMLLAEFLVRCHPERWVARRAARAGIVAVVAAGLLQLNTIVQTIPFVGGPCGPTNGDCVGTPPWARVGIAVLIGVTWFVVSLALSGAVRSVREHRRR